MFSRGLFSREMEGSYRGYIGICMVYVSNIWGYIGLTLQAGLTHALVMVQSPSP